MTLLRFIPLGLLAAAGCAATDGGHVPRIEETTANGLYGTWHWISDQQGVVKGQLILSPDATYVLTERVAEGSTSWHTSSTPGRFKVYRVADQDSLESWLELEHGGVREERVFQMVGHDTLLLRDGVSGYVVTDSEVELLVRAPLGRPQQTGQPYDEEPVPITAPTPQYPEFARDAGITGTVVLHVWIDEAGRVQEAKVVQSVVGLDQAAMEAVTKWTFKPARKAGMPVATWFEIPMTFSGR